MGEVVEGEFESKELLLPPEEQYGKPPKEMTTAALNRQSKARLNYALSELVNAGSEKVLKWLDLVAERDPAAAVRLYMELAEFSQPRLKAAQVIANLSAGDTGHASNMRSMSIEELERIANERG